MAATGTPTPNIGLRIPLGTDPASVDDINYNSNLIDTKLGAVGNDSVQDQLDDLNSKFHAGTDVATPMSAGNNYYSKGFAPSWLSGVPASGYSVCVMPIDDTATPGGDRWFITKGTGTFTVRCRSSSASTASETRAFDYMVQLL